MTCKPLTHPLVNGKAVFDHSFVLARLIMDVDDWFREESGLWAEHSIALKVNRILHQEKSPYQDILVFESTGFGNVLVLDGVVQFTQRDEQAYSEVFAHVPLNSHPSPARVLIIGGGDGGVLRDVLRHDCVEKVTLVDIDEAVIRVCRQYLPTMTCCLDDPRAEILVGDGFRFLSEREDCFDVVLVDSNDPEGPAAELYGASFMDLVYRALKSDGIVASIAAALPVKEAIGASCASTGGPCFFPTDYAFPVADTKKQEAMIRCFNDTYFLLRQRFEVVDFFWSSVPAYASGQQGFMICSKVGCNVRKPLRSWDEVEEETLCSFYTGEVHSACFVVPGEARRVLRDAEREFGERVAG